MKAIIEALQAARAAAININPVSLVLTRQTETKDATTGAYIPVETARPAQTVRIVRPERMQESTGTEKVATGGNVSNADWLVLFTGVTADVQDGDAFINPVGGGKCYIKGIRTISAGGSPVTVAAYALEVK